MKLVWQAQRESNKHKLNDIKVVTMQWHGQEYQLAHKPEVKGDKGWIKEEKAHTQAIPILKKKRDAKNEDPMTHPHHKELNEQ